MPSCIFARETYSDVPLPWARELPPLPTVHKHSMKSKFEKRHISFSLTLSHVLDIILFDGISLSVLITDSDTSVLSAESEVGRFG